MPNTDVNTHHLAGGLEEGLINDGEFYGKQGGNVGFFPAGSGGGLAFGPKQLLDVNLTHQAGGGGGILVLHRDPSVPATRGYSVLSDSNPVPTTVVAAYQDTDNNEKRETVTVVIESQAYWRLEFTAPQTSITDDNLTATFYPIVSGAGAAEDLQYRHWVRAI